MSSSFLATIKLYCWCKIRHDFVF